MVLARCFYFTYIRYFLRQHRSVRRQQSRNNNCPDERKPKDKHKLLHSQHGNL